jgi:hypothetical protein
MSELFLDDDSETSEEHSDLIREAKQRFKRSDLWESIARMRFLEDFKFYNADAYNMYQWPDTARNARGFGTGDERPCLTVNKSAKHCDMVINDSLQNKTSIRIKPVGDEASYDAAEVLEGIVRHIEYASDAQSHYSNAFKTQVISGFGVLRVTTDYVDDSSFDQDLKITSIPDPLSVYIDPDSVEPDGSDARYAFVFTDMPRDEFEVQYPEYKDRMIHTALGNDDGWIAEKHVRIAEYFYKKEIRDKLIVFTDPVSKAQTPIFKSDTSGWKGALRKALNEQLDDPMTRTRDVIRNQIKWCKIVGDDIHEMKDWAGETIPIVPVVGYKTVIEGEMDRKGHIRAMIDSQRMINYNASAAIEYGALQTKTPWVAPAASIEGQDAWGNANLVNYSVLVWNHMDDDGNPIPPPIRPMPPSGAPLYQEGMKNASDDMMMVSGQYAPLLGQPSNERSGTAINARQRQGENATYHFIDHQARAIRRLGKIIINLIPKIYDTPRVIHIMAEDGTLSTVKLDPQAKQAFEQKRAAAADVIEQVILNPTIGKYEVISDVGPDYATRRQEAFNALSQIATVNPSLMAVIGDLVLLAADFPMAEQAAERLKRMVPAQALGEENLQVQQLQQELQASQALSSSMAEKLTELQSKIRNKDIQKDVDVYKAITDRIDVLLQTQPSKTDILQFQHDLAMQEHAGNLTMASKALDNALAPEAAGEMDNADSV